MMNIQRNIDEFYQRCSNFRSVSVKKLLDSHRNKNISIIYHLIYFVWYSSKFQDIIMEEKECAYNLEIPHFGDIIFQK